MRASSDSAPGTVAADNTKLGIVVLCVFGLAWTVVLLPLSSASTPVALVAMGIAGLWTAILVFTCRRFDFTAAEETAAAAAGLTATQRQRIFVITNVAQAVVFSVTISVCIAIGRIDWIPLLAALVVGLHFMPLAWALDELSFRWAGAVLAILGGSGVLLVAVTSTTPATAVTGTAMGSAVTLLITATALLKRHGRRRYPDGVQPTTPRADQQGA